VFTVTLILSLILTVVRLELKVDEVLRENNQIRADLKTHIQWSGQETLRMDHINYMESQVMALQYRVFDAADALWPPARGPKYSTWTPGHGHDSR
jgi:hypothetical protein